MLWPGSALDPGGGGGAMGALQCSTAMEHLPALQVEEEKGSGGGTFPKVAYPVCFSANLRNNVET